MTAPQTPEEFVEAVAQRRESLPRRLQDCAAYILRHKDDLPFLTIAQASEAARIPASAFIRFAQAMGFQGYSDLQRLYRQRAASLRPDYHRRVALLRRRGGESSHFLNDFCEASLDSVERLMLNFDPAVLDAAGQAMARADLVHLVGYRRAFPVASYLAYTLGQFDMRVVLHDRVGGLETMRSFRPGEVVMAISFAPYTGAAVDLVRKARAEGARIIALSDTVLSPLHEFADIWMEVVENELSGFRSFSATFCLATALAIAVGAALDAPQRQAERD